MPSWAKGLLGVASVFGGLAAYVVVASIADPPKKTNIYRIENHIDQNLLPELEAEKPQPVEKAIEVTEIPKKKTFRPKTIRRPQPAPQQPEKKKRKPAPLKTTKPAASKPGQPPLKEKPAPQSLETAAAQPAEPRLNPEKKDRRKLLRHRYNLKRRGFSRVSYAASAVQSNTPEANRNKQDDWPVKKDTNTYPTDLTRVVTKEKFITAVLNNRIESTFAGNIVLTIDHNVYGSHGNRILIPVGAKASGKYVPVEEIGVKRLSMTIQRMVTPSGQLIVFKNPAVVADKQGAAGVSGEVDNKYLQKFGLPLAFSVANNTTNLLFQRMVDSLSDEDKEDSDLAHVFNEQWSKDQSATNREIISDIIQNNIKIMPTISIEPGTKITLYLDHDIWFKPNRNGGPTEVVSTDL